jgi:hypothetical protein
MAKTLNTDVVGYVARLDRYLIEAMNQASANTSNLKSADFQRLLSYSSARRAYLDYVSDEPDLDLPESNPKEYILDEPPKMRAIESDDLADICRMLELERYEMVHSPSARQSSGIIAFDKDRQVALIEKGERFLKNYVASVQPVDLPESSPRNETTGKGAIGINTES